ncbi:MAG: hypothetical protein U0U33_15605 [Chitinophagaceae bacterium]|nr:hypothetical protein [Panacibacter sp.]
MRNSLLTHTSSIFPETSVIFIGQAADHWASPVATPGSNFFFHISNVVRGAKAIRDVTHFKFLSSSHL